MTDVAKTASRLITNDRGGALVDVTDTLLIDELTIVDIPDVRGEHAWAVEFKGRVFDRESDVRYVMSLANRPNLTMMRDLMTQALEGKL